MIVVDTHTFLWWSDARELLSEPAFSALSSADRIAISSITGWEIGMLVAKRRLTFAIDPLTWMLDTLVRTGIEVVPLPLEAAVRSADFHLLRDPADQMIVATALHLGVPLVTKDKRIRDANIVQTVW